MKILTVVGARPQFIKAATVSREILRRAAEAPLAEVLLHTGQHFDHNMSETFFQELDIPRPQYNLDVHGGSHGEMTGRMLAGIEAVLKDERPDWVLVYGDTNSTLAAALAAVKLGVPIAHVEAGLRSFNMRMPEEINRILTDRVSARLFCPTDVAVRNLEAEGLRAGVQQVGDVMYDAALFYGEGARYGEDVLDRLGLRGRPFVLATCHRAENTDDARRLRGVVQALNALARELPVVLPLHPRTRAILERLAIPLADGVRVCDPLPYLDMVCLERNCRVVLTDSGGVQKEAYFYGVPCVTMRDETEWVETVEAGWNKLAGADPEAILAAASAYLSGRPSGRPALYGDGRSATRIVDALVAGVDAA